MGKERIIRKDLRHDAVREGVAHALAGGGSFLGENSRAMLLVLGMFAAMLVLGGWASVHASRRTMAADMALADAMRTMDGPITADTSKVAPVMRRFAFPDEKQRAEAAVARFEVVRKTYPDRKASALATILQARTLGELDRQEEGLKLLDEISTRVDDTPLAGHHARVRLSLLLDLGRFDDVQAWLTEHKSKPPVGWREGETGLVEADLLMIQGKRDAARSALEKLRDELDAMDPKPSTLADVRTRLQQDFGVTP